MRASRHNIKCASDYSVNRPIDFVFIVFAVESDAPSHQNIKQALFQELFQADIQTLSISNITLEHSFDDRRRIDILIETNEGIYGIENKLTAGFSHNQLEDYFKQLKNRNPNARLIALTPKSIRKESDRWHSATWERILKIEDHKSLRWKEFTEFVDHTINGKLPALPLGPVDEITENERDFLRVFISRYVDCVNTKIGSSKEYTGCYFGDDKSFIGYISVQIIDQQPRLVILTPDAYLPNSFSDTDSSGALWMEARNTSWQRYEREVLGDEYQMWVLSVQPKSGAAWDTVGNELAKSIHDRLEMLEKSAEN